MTTTGLQSFLKSFLHILAIFLYNKPVKAWEIIEPESDLKA